MQRHALEVPAAQTNYHHVVLRRALTIERSLRHGDVALIVAMARRLGLEKLLGPPCPERDLALALIVARCCAPSSKLATTRWWTDTSLAGDLVAEGTGTDEADAAMDWLVSRQASIEASPARRHLEKGAMVLYDLSSSWVEGSHCPLAARGYSRDHKGGKAQIEYGLMTDAEGRPVSVEVFSGNTADPSAFVSAVESVRTRFKLEVFEEWVWRETSTRASTARSPDALLRVRHTDTWFVDV